MNSPKSKAVWIPSSAQVDRYTHPLHSMKGRLSEKLWKSGWNVCAVTEGNGANQHPKSTALFSRAVPVGLYFLAEDYTALK